MREIQISNQAKADLVAIWNYIAQDSPRAADRLVNTIAATYIKLIASPGVGRNRHELRPGIYSLPVRNYVVFYRFTEAAVYVVRVVHGARNLRAIFRKERDETYAPEDEK